MDAIDRLRNLRTAPMTDDLDLPTAPEIMRRAKLRRQRRRIGAAIVGLAATAAVIGAVLGIVLRDDDDTVSTVDDPPRTTVTLDPTTSPTTDSTTTTSTTTSTTAAPPVLKPPDSPTPAAGTCGWSDVPVAESTIYDDVPGPRCLQVTADQKLQITNGLTVPITVDFADFHTMIQPGQDYLFDRPFGDYLQLGVHRMEITHDLPDANRSGPEIFLVETPGPS